MTQPIQIDLKSGHILPYCGSIFLSALLLFQVQLLLGKYFLPWFGGTPAMWTTCMFFFQTLLLVGYFYAYLVADWVPLRLQGKLHMAVLLGALSLLILTAIRWHSPLMPDSSWKPSGPEHPVGYLALLLTVSAGVPFFSLSTTGPLLQSWFAKTHPGVAPYRLYALSNLGSFLALLTYPLVVEPWFTLKMQARLRSGGFCLFVLFCAFCALQPRMKSALRWQNDVSDDDGRNRPQVGAHRPGFWKCILWLSLAACGSLLFLANGPIPSNFAKFSPYQR